METDLARPDNRLIPRPLCIKKRKGLGMIENCASYPRKTLYLILTIPMIGIYIGIAVLLWKVNRTFFAVYLSQFVLVALFQSYVCVYWRCPYVGGFAPCVGGFCLPSSQLARVLKNAKRSEGLYNVAVTLAFASFLSIIVLPMYFIYQQSAIYLLVYLGIVLVYAASFFWWICPVCGTRHVCPGGQTSTKLRELLKQK
ncbi:MAG: hypothetical protein JW929_15205 [Anaerolineales bacterium]|nr:hypothetical protein [Anaerolineales bacterium]